MNAAKKTTKSGPTQQELIEARLKELSTRILANLVMVGQIPAPTGDEKARARYMIDRFNSLGLEDVGQDEAGNVFAKFPATTSNVNVF